MLGARRRQANGMDTTPTKHTAALYTMASLSQNDTPVYMLSELQCALLLHHLAIVWQSQGNIPTTADNVAHVLGNTHAVGGSDKEVLRAFLLAHRRAFLWSLVPTSRNEWLDMCLPLDIRDVNGHTLAEHLLRGGSDHQLAAVTGALSRGVHIPGVRMTSWPRAPGPGAASRRTRCPCCSPRQALG